jgi:ABC-type multidrug transport system ATPase subunit
MVAHRLSTIRHADQILVLNHGQLLQHGTHDELVEQDGLYRQLWHAQVMDRKRPLRSPAALGRHAAPPLPSEMATG